MKLLKTSSILCILGLLAPAFAPFATAGDAKRFEAEKCFPLECLGYLRVASGRGLCEALKSTLPGKIASDPETAAVLGKLPGMARDWIHSMSEPVIEITGKDPLELVDLFEGEIALSIVGIDPASKVTVVAALELGSQKEAILGVMGKISEFLARSSGGKLPETEIVGRKAVTWPLFGGLTAIHHVPLGTHLVFSTSADALRGIAETFDGKGQGAEFTLAGNPRYAEARSGLAVAQERFFAFSNVEAIRGLAMTFAQQVPDSEDILKVLRRTGLLNITALGYSLGSRDGDIESKMLLGTGGEAKGLLGDFLGSLSPAENPAAALELVPAEAHFFTACAVHPGKAVQGIRKFIQGLPKEFTEEIDGFLKKTEEKSGISLEKDLSELGRLDEYFFCVDPPAGGLLPDMLTLVRTEAFAPYRALGERVLKALGKEAKTLPGPEGKQIRYLKAGSVLTRLAGIEAGDEEDKLIEALVQPPISIAFAELEGGWTIASNAPQPIWRYLAGAKGKRLSSVEEIARIVRENQGKSSLLVAFRTGKSFLPVYNTLGILADLLGSSFEEFIAPYGVDLALLPPGEKFLGGLKDGFIRVETGPQGILIHEHRLLSSSCGLCLPVVLGAAAASWGYAMEFSREF